MIMEYPGAMASVTGKAKNPCGSFLKKRKRNHAFMLCLRTLLQKVLFVLINDSETITDLQHKKNRKYFFHVWSYKSMSVMNAKGNLQYEHY